MDQLSNKVQGSVCPVPLAHEEMIILGHGSGGILTHNLIKRHFLTAFDNPIINAGNDAGLIEIITPGNRLAVSTDSHVVWPLFFPGGDIGRLAVCGTVNDVSMLGAVPKYMTAGFIIEEGFPLEKLDLIIQSMKHAAEEAGVIIVAGDTKVVQKGKADGIYINTSGIGIVNTNLLIGGERAQPGDAIIISGPIGDHGIAVLAARNELGFTADIQSDIAPMNHIIAALLDAKCDLHVLRDPTRGGLATSLNEIAIQSNQCIHIYESRIPIRPVVSAACEMLGLDPLYIANEGKLIVIVSSKDREKALTVMHESKYGEDSCIIGEVHPAPGGRVLMKTVIGTTRVIDILSGELLPRIC